jgi:hypothetical protein
LEEATPTLEQHEVQQSIAAFLEDSFLSEANEIGQQVIPDDDSELDFDVAETDACAILSEEESWSEEENGAQK